MHEFFPVIIFAGFGLFCILLLYKLTKALLESEPPLEKRKRR